MSPRAQLFNGSAVLGGYRNVRKMGHGVETGNWDMPLKVVNWILLSSLLSFYNEVSSLHPRHPKCLDSLLKYMGSSNHGLIP